MGIIRNSGLCTVEKERDTYPWISNLYRKRGFLVKRIEGVPTVPDFWMGKGREFMWLEIKVYRGGKPLEKVTLEDLVFQPGQLAFRHEVHKKCAPSCWCVLVFNKRGLYTLLN